ncbi:hypothetical protein GIB67_005808 [Kingdonia uniflora]|uniref:Uncharacterized protein n=1 Tax=Kingdonia uniflora TaxID=39325 RepID=A0A7J7MBG0_9MAGN|nr:hypothetical protein GIB67_005808 [Kingdonia uniflora]
MASASNLAAGRAIATPASPKVSPLRRTPIWLTLQGGLLNASSLTRTSQCLFSNEDLTLASVLAKLWWT